MAKELPFFKFEPSEWDNGRIQMCSFEAQGVYINICSMYWHRLGDLPYKLALQKICKGNADALQSLCDEGVLKVIDDQICIDFLNEQLAEFNSTSKTNSEAARKRWAKHRKNADALQPENECNAIRGEKIREDKTSKGDWEIWGKSIVADNDQYWQQMKGRKITQQEMDEFLSVATRNDWKMDTQQEFRTSLKGFKSNKPADQIQPTTTIRISDQPRKVHA